MDIGVDRTVEADLCRAALRVVEEVQLIGMLNFIEVGVVYFHVRQQLSVVGVVRGFWVPVMLQYLLDSHTVVIVLEVQRPIFSNHLLQLAACRPGERPRAVVQRILDCVIGNGSASVRSQFVFSAAVAIGVRNSLNRGTQRTSGVSILRLAGDAAAVVVGALE